MHAGLDLPQYGDYVVAKLVRIATEEAVVVVSVGPIAGLEGLQVAAVGCPAVAVDDVADRLAVQKVCQLAFEVGETGFGISAHDFASLEMIAEGVERPPEILRRFAHLHCVSNGTKPVHWVFGMPGAT